MIGQIRGTLIARQAPEILVDVGGIGYEIQVPMTTLYQLPELGQPVTCLLYTSPSPRDAHESRMPSSA